MKQKDQEKTNEKLICENEYIEQRIQRIQRDHSCWLSFKNDLKYTVYEIGNGK